ncbi:MULTISPECIES: glycoside hydrolase family 88 protein [unclassified Leifsonia]|uniref:glycoside hydrolase family 88 protein n=1 Tax=unclassified Leifsonia TaxID=2663824 RepID=UPI0008A7472C|nr:MULTISPECIES: glycoside hydrolase family 88 protein [unclassified Leifsonia]SEI11313.1 unsaturated chondroitin disaccharide hydrolase [Leifsonia sp. CL154]SFL88736.1 unsaturated chondroitin disaccharide hydrolase [Leifsonia sp. CL147]
MTSLSSAPGYTGAIRTEARAALETAIGTTRRTIEKFAAAYPDDTTDDGVYRPRPALGDIPEGGNHGWTTSFVPGMQWIAWEATGDDAFREAALRHARDFERRVNEGQDLDTHDLGFLYSLSCVAAWRLTGDEDARRAALAAADHLMTRFLEPAGIVQAWGDLSDPRQAGRTIIDSLMNMPLLTWASEQTGDERYADAVRRHTLQLRDHIVRPDDSTFHTFYWDVETGEPLRGATEQGAHDDSCWARGQAWGVYGFALNFRATGDERFLDASRRCAAYFLAHLPADDVPYWDLVYTDGSDAPRDSSAAAIAVSGLRELAIAEDDPEAAARATEAADRILASLIENYTPADDVSDALLLHGVYNLPGDHGVDEGTLWGDYFYLEALMRTVDPGWRLYW